MNELKINKQNKGYKNLLNQKEIDDIANKVVQKINELNNNEVSVKNLLVTNNLINNVHNIDQNQQFFNTQKLQNLLISNKSSKSSKSSKSNKSNKSNISLLNENNQLEIVDKNNLSINYNLSKNNNDENNNNIPKKFFYKFNDKFVDLTDKQDILHNIIIYSVSDYIKYYQNINLYNINHNINLYNENHKEVSIQDIMQEYQNNNYYKINDIKYNEYNNFIKEQEKVQNGGAKKKHSTFTTKDRSVKKQVSREAFKEKSVSKKREKTTKLVRESSMTISKRGKSKEKKSKSKEHKLKEIKPKMKRSNSKEK